MQKQSLYTKLQQQYKKLNNRIQKNIKNGRFYSFTQFKQAQLFGRLNRYSLQLRKLGVGVVACAALGLSTPAIGQVAPDFMEKTGIDNPFNSIANDIKTLKPSFVDLDNDGDLDMFVTKVNTSTSYFDIYYYKILR